MAKISYSSQALVNLEQIIDFLSNSEPGAPADALDLIDEAIIILTLQFVINAKPVTTAKSPSVWELIDQCAPEHQLLFEG
jgi:hypothetical protein